MKLTYDVTLPDVMAYHLEYLYCSPEMQKNRKLNRFLGPICCVFLAVFPMISAGRVLWFWGICCAAAGVGSFLLFPGRERKTIRRVVNSSAKKGRLDKMMGTYTLELGEEEISVSHETKGARFPYSKILRLGRHEDWLFLYIGEREAYIVPPTAFQTPEEKEEFIRLVEGKMKAQPALPGNG